MNDGQLTRMEKILARLETIRTRAGEELLAYKPLVDLLSGAIQRAKHPVAVSPAMRIPPVRPVPIGSNPSPPARAVEGGLSGSQQRILDALAWLESVGIPQANKTQVALLADQSPTSGGYFNNLGKLRSYGLIEYPSPSILALTDGGRTCAQTGDIPTTSEELHAQLFRRLSKSQGEILRQLIADYPRDIAKDDLAKRSGQSATSGGYFNNLGRLRSLGLIDYPNRGRVCALRVLFLEA